jgi:site-specific DNA-methyltransferase (adenine-specific)
VGEYVLHHGDCLEVLKTLADSSVDAVVTDPPYGLAFMGKRWDYDVPSVEVWAECLRVLKPGGHLLAFAGTRTQHRMAVRIEDAGFEIRDMIAWVYGSGFPKSLDVSKAIDKAAGAEREVVGTRTDGRGKSHQKINNHGQGDTGIGHADGSKQTYCETAPATESARQWSGWGTALKPAMEPITVARKPLVGTVAANVLEHGTGAINVDGCRVGAEVLPEAIAGQAKLGTFERGVMLTPERTGRWPANLIHDGSDEVVAGFPATKSGQLNRANITAENAIYGKRPQQLSGEYKASSGSASRFFYCAKASKRDRDEGCEGMEEKEAGIKNDSGRGFSESDPMAKIMRRNHHPTVKPTDLMRYLCRLITPPNGTILDPFTGSGSTGKAAMLEGFRFIGIEREAEYVEIAKARIEAAKK